MRLKLLAVIKHLAKIGLEERKETDKKISPMKSAIAFCQSIPISKLFEEEFLNVISEFKANEKIDEKDKVDLKVEISHVDGSLQCNEA